MLATAKTGVYAIADSQQSGFVNLYKNPEDSTSFVKKINTGDVAGKLTGNVKVVGNLRFAEVVYNERFLLPDEKGFANMNLLSEAGTQTKAYYSIGDNVRVRSTPSAANDSNIVKSVSKGALVGYSNGTEKSGFIQLNSALSTGTVYVKKEYLTTSKESITNPTTKNPEPAPSQNKPIETVINEAGVKTIKVLGASIPASNNDLIVYSLVVGLTVVAISIIRKKLKGN